MEPTRGFELPASGSRFYETTAAEIRSARVRSGLAAYLTAYRPRRAKSPLSPGRLFEAGEQPRHRARQHHQASSGGPRARLHRDAGEAMSATLSPRLQLGQARGYEHGSGPRVTRRSESDVPEREGRRPGAIGQRDASTRQTPWAAPVVGQFECHFAGLCDSPAAGNRRLS